MRSRGSATLAKKLLKQQRIKMKAIQLIHRIKIDRNGKQLTVYAGKHAMLVGSPRREPGQVFKDLKRIRMEDVRPVFMHQNAIVIVGIVGITSNMILPVNQQHTFTRLRCQPFGQHASRKPRPNDQIIKHALPFLEKVSCIPSLG